MVGAYISLERGCADEVVGSMSERYIISPLEETSDLRVDIDHLFREVRARWPDADVRRGSDAGDLGDPEILSWVMVVTKYSMYCWLSRTQQALHLEGGSTEDCAKVALMFRELVPARYRLFYYDQGFNEVMEITKDTTEQDFIDTWGGGPY
jgi:hypothetical protein